MKIINTLTSITLLAMVASVAPTIAMAGTTAEKAAMEKKAMKEAAMAKDGMKKDAMAKDGMKKDTMMVSHYVIKSGDSLWTIAKSTYGDGAMYPKIMAANTGIDASNLMVGKTIDLPK